MRHWKKTAHANEDLRISVEEIANAAIKEKNKEKRAIIKQFSKRDNEKD